MAAPQVRSILDPTKRSLMRAMRLPVTGRILDGNNEPKEAAMSTTSHNDLEGQRALVTGATSGIGRAVALQLARDGAEVLVHGRDVARGAETVKEITAAGGKASFVAANLGDPADVQRLAVDVGEVDILINNAGIAAFGPTAEFDPAMFDKMFAS